MTALACAALLAASAILTDAHTHHGGLPGFLGGRSFGVPVSVITNPDAPSSSQHWHAGRTFNEEPCAACLLGHYPGSVSGWTYAGPSVVTAWVVVPPAPGGSIPLLRPASARAPPSLVEAFTA